MKNKFFFFTMLILMIGLAAAVAFAGNWWDKLGKPKYGGTINLHAIDLSSPNYDTQNFGGAQYEFWYEALFEPDATIDPDVWSFSNMFYPDQYWKGNLVETWEFTDARTIKARIRKGIHWQDKPPVNGREFTADDVQHHYDRIFGRGNYTKPNMMFMGMIANWESVTATDRYTVVFKFKTPSAGVAFQSIADRFPLNVIEPPEVVKEQGGAITDWKKVVGTGPFLLKDVVVGSSMTFVPNPDYWGTDPLHPENKIPYVDELKIMAIPDKSTQYAALRTGKVDILSANALEANSGVPWMQAKALQEKNPDLKHGKISVGTSGVTFRMDKEPFTDIRVRKAMQMAINRKDIARSYYGGTAPETPCGIITQAYKGYAYDYGDWPQELKDEYSYNPEKARKLLAEAGYPKGFKTNIVASTRNDLQLLEVFKAFFLDIGVDMEIRAMEGMAAADFVRASKHDQMAGWGGGFPWPHTRIIDQFYSTGPDSGITMVRDDGYDAIRDKFWSSGTPEEAAKLMMEADKYIIEKHWMVSGPEISAYSFWRPRLRGFNNENLGHGQGLTLARLWVEEK